ncbi:MAG: GNAT family N-acetyltransferase [Chitinophagaceae bacterium]|nr:GNAT family N-acetyltransferase [Chitinophagaceae bacterium]
MQQENYKQSFPDSFTLETPRVLLRLIQPADLAALQPLTKHEELWKYFTKKLDDDGELKQWIDEALADRNKSVRMPFTVIDKHTNSICGSTSYGNISFFDKRLEIGWSWLGDEFRSTGVNRNAKFALLSHAFEALKFERVEVKTDYLNERARKALLKIGMYEEGVLRSHMQMHSNRRRDSTYYSIIKDEWPTVKKKFFSEMA